MLLDMAQRVLDLALGGPRRKTTLRDRSAVWLRPLGAGDETALTPSSAPAPAAAGT
jgi:hypothetical protein